MSYAQQSYPQPLGNSPTITIAEAGCLLTAISNLLLKFNGVAPDPYTLDSFYIAHGDFLYDTADHSSDDLAWNSITKYDPTIVLSNQGAGAPGDNNAIVKFRYNSVHTGQPIDHYCAVDHIGTDGIYIIDSWDGQIKAPSAYENVYHFPVAYGTYAKVVPQPIVPIVPEPIVVTAPPAAPVPFPGQGNPYSVIIPLQGYQSATAAGNHSGLATPISEGDYYIFRYYPGNENLINITEVKNQPGWWINDADNVLPPVPTPVIAAPANYVGPREDTSVTVPEVVEVPPAVTISKLYKPSEVPVGDSSDTKWKSTYKSFNIDRSPDTYELLIDYTMQEYSGTRKPVQLTKGRRINTLGTFTKNGVKFYRPRDYHNDVTFSLFYGVPVLDDENMPIMRKVVDEPTPQHFADLWRLWKSDLKNYLGHHKIMDVLKPTKRS